ncbi:MAG: pectinesterase family protein, partial [Candidatus Bathyarchaeota archaeon]|nr:pectinesterase family protein [Candidatus Bathyarchaeota archaeon]
MALRRTVLVSSLVLCLVLVLVPTLNFVNAESNTIVVPDDYSTIQEAINNASDGDTVFVKAGTYYEALVIETSISLVGEDSASTVIDGSNSSVTDVVQVKADNVTVSGFTIRNSSGAKYYEKAGVYVEFSSGANISGNIIMDNYGHGVHLVGSSNC